MAWGYLLLASAFEIAFAACLKYAEGFTRLVPSIGFVVAYAASAWFLAVAVKTIPIGTAYAVWTGIGAVGTAVLGIVLFNEPATALRLLFLTVIIIGIVGLKMVSGPSA